VLGGLPVTADDRVLVDYRTADDAGVYKLDNERALVQTVDFFTPIVDDAYTYGQIAAANALSDVYAMGGRPITALAIAAFPKDLDPSVLGRIFAGGLEVLQRAGVALLGGHTVQDQEIKFGYAVTGEVHPRRIWMNAGAHSGDVLFLTKPLGTGVIATALKADRAPAAAVSEAVQSMSRLNRESSEALQSLPADAVHACTDITGFGLIGHGSEIAVASGVTLEFDTASIPILPGALDLASANIPGGGRTNAEHFGVDVLVSPGVPADLVTLLHDPQTSGGLLASIASAYADAAEAALRRVDPSTRRIGRVSPRGASRLILR
jgi:selenide, water dikinase